MLLPEDFTDWERPRLPIFLPSPEPGFLRIHDDEQSGGAVVGIFDAGSDPWKVEAVARAWEAEKHLGLAKEWYARAVAEGSTSALNDSGVMLAANGDIDGAGELFAGCASGTHPEATHNLALWRSLTGDDPADAAGVLSADVCASYPPSTYLRSWLLALAGEEDAASTVMLAAAEQRYSPAMNAIGIHLLQDGDLDAAESYFRLSAESGLLEAINNLAGLLEVREDSGASHWYRSVLTRGLSTAMTMEVVRNSRRQTSARSSGGDGAETNGESGGDGVTRITAAPGSVVCLFNYAGHCQERGDLSESSRIYRAVVRAGVPEAAYRLAVSSDTSISEGERILHLRWAAIIGVEPALLLEALVELRRDGDSRAVMELLSDDRLADDPVAQRALAMGTIRAGDADRGYRLLSAAAELGDNHAKVQLALHDVELDHIADARRRLSEARAEGDPVAAVLEFELAAMYDSISDFGPFEEQLEYAACERHPRAAAHLAEIAFGRGDLVTAEYWGRLASSRGDCGSAHLVAMCMYEVGLTGACIKWLRNAAELGHPEAAEHLRSLLPQARDERLRGAPLGLHLARILERKAQTERPREWYELLAGRGDGQALAWLARQERSSGHRSAFEKLARASAITGAADGQYLWAMALRENGKKDATAWLEKAALAGSADACLALGSALAQEQDDMRSADLWLQRSWDLGAESAAAEIGRIALASGERERAIMWWQRGSEVGCQECKLLLAENAKAGDVCYQDWVQGSLFETNEQSLRVRQDRIRANFSLANAERASDGAAALNMLDAAARASA